MDLFSVSRELLKYMHKDTANLTVSYLNRYAEKDEIGKNRFQFIFFDDEPVFRQWALDNRACYTHVTHKEFQPRTRFGYDLFKSGNRWTVAIFMQTSSLTPSVSSPRSLSDKLGIINQVLEHEKEGVGKTVFGNTLVFGSQIKMYDYVHYSLLLFAQTLWIGLPLKDEAIDFNYFPSLYWQNFHSTTIGNGLGKFVKGKFTLGEWNITVLRKIHLTYQNQETSFLYLYEMTSPFTRVKWHFLSNVVFPRTKGRNRDEIHFQYLTPTSLKSDASPFLTLFLSSLISHTTSNVHSPYRGDTRLIHSDGVRSVSSSGIDWANCTTNTCPEIKQAIADFEVKIENYFTYIL